MSCESRHAVRGLRTHENRARKEADVSCDLDVRLKELKIYIKVLSENMDLVRPKSHQTLEIEYRRLRRQLHHTADDKIFSDFKSLDGSSSPQQWINSRSEQHFRVARNNIAFGRLSVGSDVTYERTASALAVKGDAFGKMTSQSIGAGNMDAGKGNLSAKTSKPNSTSPDVMSETDTKVSCLHDVPDVTSIRSGSSNSKGHRVRFAPEVECEVISPRRKSYFKTNKPQRKKLFVNVTSLSANYYNDEQKLFYTHKTMTDFMSSKLKR